MSDASKYAEIFDYLSAPELPTAAEPAIVFGRNDPLVARALGDLIIPDLVKVAVISGGVGKDTGDLLARGYRSEASFLHWQMGVDAIEREYVVPRIVLDEKAIDGFDNASNSMDILIAEGYNPTPSTAVAHPTSLRCLSETLKFEASKRFGATPVIHRKPSSYKFDPEDPADRDEAAKELLRLAEWPAKGLLGLQKGLPEDLVDFAKGRHGEAPMPPRSWKKNILKRLPPRYRLRVLEFAK